MARTVSKTEEQFESFARTYGWKLKSHDHKQKFIRYKRDSVTLTLHYESFSVITTMYHPKRGQSRLQRKRLTLTEIERIFENPRTHNTHGGVLINKARIYG